MAQKASCHGFTRRRGSGAYDANKRAEKITREQTAPQTRQLHKPVFPLEEGSRSSVFFGDRQQAKIMSNKT